MYDANDCKSVMAHTRRPEYPRGVDPQDIQPTLLDDRGWIVATNIAKVTPTDVQIMEFNVREGRLFRYDEQPDYEPELEPEPDPPEPGEIDESYADVDLPS